MAIPSMVQNFAVQTANGQNLVSWDFSAGATSYSIQRSTDNITYSVVATVSANTYLDPSVTLGNTYFYQVASVNGSGTSAYSAPQSVIPSTTGEMSLSAIRQAAQERADMVNSGFVSTTEWNSFINRALFELYDLLITVGEDYFIAAPISFTANGSQYIFPLPNGVLSFTDQNGNSVVAPPYYKLSGVDLAVNTASNAYVTVPKYNWDSRNNLVYPNTASTIYGVFNLQYRVMGNNIQFIPTPSGGQILRLWYMPRMKQLLQDNDITAFGISGWLEYVIVRAAKYALDKEESDTSKLDQELLFLKQRIEETAANRDAGRPDTVSNVRSNVWGSGWDSGGYGPTGGW